MASSKSVLQNKEKVIEAIALSSSQKEVLLYLGIRTTKGNYKSLQNVCKEMGLELPTALPTELIPELKFDVDGSPVIYSLGEQQLRDGKAVISYLATLVDRYSIGTVGFFLLAPVSAAFLIILALHGYWIELIFPGPILPLYALVISGQFRADAYKSERVNPFKDMMRVERRKLFKSWAEENLKSEQSEKELDELQNRMGEARLEAEKEKERELMPLVEVQLPQQSSKQKAQNLQQDVQEDILPYWMGGPMLEEAEPQRPATLNNPVMS